MTQQEYVLQLMRVRHIYVQMAEYPFFAWVGKKYIKYKTRQLTNTYING